MKRTAMLLVGIVMCHGVYSQKHDRNPENTHPGDYPAKYQPLMEQEEIQAMQKARTAVSAQKSKSSAAVRWSEDFANGFSGSANGAWTVGGANSNLVMYDTDGPDSLLQFGWGPLPSPTASNGFAIMDWYRRIPDVGGFATSPAQGILTSPTIDLGTDPDVFISFYQQLFHCCNLDLEVVMEVSTDGGATWPHSYITSVTDRNIRHWNVGYGYYFEFDISSAVAADPSNVKIRFNWTSLTADANGQFSNVYFWMIDDITISDLPRHKVKFTDWQNAPEHDIIYDGGNGNSRYGHFTVDEAPSIIFDSNIYNFGSQDQTGVDLVVEFFDAAGNPAGSVSSNNQSVLVKGDTLNFNSLTTSAWTPPSKGEYTFVYTIVSDSIPAHPDSEAVRDSFELEMTDSVTSLDFGIFHNAIGTDELGDNGAIGVRFTYDNPASTHIDLYSLRIDYSTATVAGGTIQIEVYDTTGFTFQGGFGNSPLVNKAFSVDADADNGAFVEYDLTNANGEPVALPMGTYYFVVNMFSNSDSNPVAIANNASFNVDDASSIMFDVDENRWFTGYNNSDVLNSPVIRAVTAHNIVSLEEQQRAWLHVFPNPADGKFKLQMQSGGEFTIDLIGISGKVVDQRNLVISGNEVIDLDYSWMPPGTYMLKVRGGNGEQKTARIIIQ